jgi:iron(III) transport system permease protein
MKKGLAYAPLLVLLAAMTAIPLVMLFLTSAVPEGGYPFDPASVYTFDNYREVFADPATYRVLLNTFAFAFGTLLFGVSIAIIMAWLIERTDMPLKDYAYIAIFLPMAMPGFITAIGWTFLLNPANGLINVFLRNLFGLDAEFGPFDVYSLGGMIMVAGLALGPIMFIMLSSLMRNLDPNLEDSAYASGASGADVLRRVIIPLLRPGLLSVFIYFFVTAFEMLEIPLVFGTNAHFDVLSVIVYQKTAGSSMDLPNYGLSSAYATIGLAIGLVLLTIYFRLIRQADRFVVITGKGYRPKQYKLGRLGKLAAGVFFVFFLSLKLILPLLVLLWSSLLPFFQSPSMAALKSVSLRNYEALFRMDRFLLAVGNTLIMMVLAAVICMGLATLVSWIVVRGRGPICKIIDVTAFLPHLVPGLVIALALLLTSVRTPLYGTLSVLIIGYIIRYLPFGVRMITSVMYQVAAELEDAAYASGASRIVTFRRIVLPLVLPAFTSGLIWIGSQSMKDLTLPLFLVSSSNLVIGGLLWETWGRSEGEMTAAMSVMLVAVLLCIVAPLQLYMRRRAQRFDTSFGEVI